MTDDNSPTPSARSSYGHINNVNYHSYFNAMESSFLTFECDFEINDSNHGNITHAFISIETGHPNAHFQSYTQQSTQPT